MVLGEPVTVGCSPMRCGLGIDAFMPAKSVTAHAADVGSLLSLSNTFSGIVLPTIPVGSSSACRLINFRHAWPCVAWCHVCCPGVSLLRLLGVSRNTSLVLCKIGVRAGTTSLISTLSSSCTGAGLRRRASGCFAILGFRNLVDLSLPLSPFPICVCPTWNDYVCQG